MKKKTFIIVLPIAILMAACGMDDQNDRPEINPDKLEKPLMNANKIMVQKEKEKIDSYIKRHKWKMKETGTGLRYYIYHNGDGQRASTGKTAVINYKVSLLDGTNCYSSMPQDNRYKEPVPKIFKIGHGQVESGLEEAILLLKVGDKAKFILPSHLAYGLLGDGDKIPSHAAIVYDIELVELR